MSPPERLPGWALLRLDVGGKMILGGAGYDLRDVSGVDGRRYVARWPDRTADRRVARSADRPACAAVTLLCEPEPLSSQATKRAYLASLRWR
jgi:hypothetical protein